MIASAMTDMIPNITATETVKLLFRASYIKFVFTDFPIIAILLPTHVLL